MSDVEGAPSEPAVQATVIGRLPNEMFRLRLQDGQQVDAHAAKNLRMAYVRLVPGDVVEIDRSPFDPDKARIIRIRKLKHQQQAGHQQNSNTTPPSATESNP